jgi:predicted TIM-barrel fold metal-dependent hydrolase
MIGTGVGGGGVGGVSGGGGGGGVDGSGGGVCGGGGGGPSGVKRLVVTDPHVHFWDRSVVRYPWLDNAGVAYSGDNRLLPESFSVPDLLQGAGKVDVRRTVHVEANPGNALEEVRWLQSLADEPQSGGHPHGIVACADFSQSDVSDRLAEFASCQNLRGIRQILNVHTDSRYDYVGRHYMRESPWRDNLRQLAEFGWSFDLQIYPSQVEDAVRVIDANPDVTFVLNHAGMFVDRDSPEGWRRWRDGLRQLAGCGNVAAKLSGFAMFDHQWTVESLRPQVFEAIDAFGVDRCMFASNFPLDGLHSDYERLWGAYAAVVAGMPEADREGLFAGNAIRYYRLSPS